MKVDAIMPSTLHGCGKAVSVMRPVCIHVNKCCFVKSSIILAEIYSYSIEHSRDLSSVILPLRFTAKDGQQWPFLTVASVNPGFFNTMWDSFSVGAALDWDVHVESGEFLMQC